MCTARGTGEGWGGEEGHDGAVRGAGGGGAPRTCTFHALLPRHKRAPCRPNLSLEQGRLGRRGEILHTMGILWHSKDKAPYTELMHFTEMGFE